MHRAGPLVAAAPLTAYRLAVALAATSLCGCPDNAELNDDFIVPTAIAILPAGFLGDVHCSNEPGAMRSYVATITDRTDPGATFTLPSSPPTPCSQRVQFRYVVPGHLYDAEIDGYEEYADELSPLGGDGSGSRHQEKASGEPLTPRWQTRCEEATAIDGATTPVGPCEPLEDHAGGGVTAVAVDPTAALGELRCASAGGEIESFVVAPQGGNLPAVSGISCPPTTGPVVYNAGIVPGQTYTFRIDAAAPPTGPFAGATYSASCSVTAAEGVTVTATCDPLTARGALSIPIGAILEAAQPQLSCGPGGASTYVATLPIPGGSELQAVLPCTESAHFAPLFPGAYVASVDVRGEDGSLSLAHASCTGDVEAGATTVATCSIAPP